MFTGVHSVFFFIHFSVSTFPSCVLRQNAELAKLRQECTKLSKELGEKTESLLADEHIRKGLEAKVSATEKQLARLQVDQTFGTHKSIIAFPYGHVFISFTVF